MTRDEAIDRVARSLVPLYLTKFNPSRNDRPAGEQLIAFYKRHWAEHSMSFPHREVEAAMRAAVIGPA